MRRQGRKIRLYPALTLIETVLSLTIMAIVFAVLLPQIRMINNSWDSKAGIAESLQNGRVLIDHLNRNLSRAARITAVSNSLETDGYIEFEDSASSTLRYDIAANNNVEFGTIGSLNDLAGPVSQLLFACYDGNDMVTAITDVNDIRLVNVQAILTNASAGVRDLTVGTSVYLRPGPLPGEVVDPNLILWLKLDEASGLIAADISGNGNDGTLTNMAGNEWTTGRVDGGLEFDGSDDAITGIGNCPAGNFTLACWAKNTGSSDWMTIYSAEQEIWLGVDPGASPSIWLDCGGAGNGAYTAAGTWTLDTWHHIAMTWDGTTVHLYLDGDDMGIIIYGTPEDPLSTAAVIGSWSLDPTDENWCGILDDVRLYDRVLSSEEIAKLFGVKYLEFTEAKASSDTTSITISTPPGTNEGDLLITAVGTDGDTSASMAPPAGEGWTQVFCNDQSGQVTIGVWWKLADASESASHEFTWSGGQQVYGWMMRFDGHNPADPIQAYSADGETSASPSSPPVTTQNKCLILRLGAFDDDHITLGDPGLSGHTAITMDSSSGVSYEEFSEAKAGSGTTSLTIDTPAGTAEGDLLIAAVVTDDNNKDSLAPPAGEGWTLIGVDDKKKVTLGAWWKLADASESPSHQFTWSKSEETYGWIMRFAGHDPSGPIGQAAKAEGGSSAPGCPSVTTVVANSMILRIGGFDDDDINLDVTGLMEHTAITMDESSSGDNTCSGGAGYQQQATPGTTDSADFNLTDSEEYVILTVAITPATGGSGTVSGGAGYVTQSRSGYSGWSNFSLTASQEARTVTIAIAPVP